MPIEVVVLAAGLGKRMRSELPKVLHPLAGKPLLGHVIDAVRSLAPRRIFVVHGHGAEAVRAAFPAPDIAWVLQREQLGTGHAVQQAAPHLASDADVLLLYGDVPLIRPETLRDLMRAAGDGLALLSADLPDPAGYGRVVRDASGRVARIVEQRDATPAEAAIREVNAGFYALPVKRLLPWLKKIGNNNAQKEYYLTDLVGSAVAEGIAVTAVKAAHWAEAMGVNSKRELAELERHHQRRQADRLLEAGVSLADPARVDVRGELQCGRDVAIDVNCVFEGKVSLGDGVQIGPSCVLRNVSIEKGSQVLAFSLLEDSSIGERCRIGPYARLRPGAVLEQDVHVGNFVEVKASRLGAGAKANHLAYVGDAEVGARVNIGAGTITCNYDGGAKHRTIIEDDCFIGSDATLVAPVRIGKGSYVGAGSTITKDTPPGQLTVGRAKQVSIPSWKPPKKKA